MLIFIPVLSSIHYFVVKPVVEDPGFDVQPIGKLGIVAKGAFFECEIGSDHGLSIGKSRHRSHPIGVKADHACNL